MADEQSASALFVVSLPLRLESLLHMKHVETFGQLKEAGYRTRSVKDELRENLIKKLRAGEKLFPGIVGYADTVIPQLINAVLARHNIILLGLRGQAKSRIIRQLTELLDESIPIIAGSEVNDDPLKPISAFGRQTIELHGDMARIDWIDRERQFSDEVRLRGAGLHESGGA